MTCLRVVTVAEDLDREGLLAADLADRRDAELVLRCVDRVELLAAIRGANLDALIVVGDVTWFDRQCAAESAAGGIKVISVVAGAPVIGSSATLPLDAGVEEILLACSSAAPSTLPEQVDSQGAVSEGTGRLTAIWGPKGSPGRTRISIELALELAQTGIEVGLIDADPYGGDVSQALAVVDELPNLVWASRVAAKGRWDREEIGGSLRRVAPGVVLVPGLPRAELWADVSDFGFRELLVATKGLFDHCLCDTGFCLEASGTERLDGGQGRNRMTRAALEESDRVVAVCDAQPIGLKNFLWAYEDLTRLVDPDRIVVVANKVIDGTEREVSDLLRRETGKRPTAYVPDRPEMARRAVLDGVPMAGSKGAGDVRAAIQALAISIGARIRPSGVLSRLGGKRG